MAVNYIIVGNGVAGINAAVTLRLRDQNAIIKVISAETPYYYSRTALMYIAMDTLRLEDTEPRERKFYLNQNIELIQSNVNAADSAGKKVFLEDGSWLSYDRLLLATGALPAMYGWPGSDLEGVVNFVSYHDLLNIKKYSRTSRNAVVVGGGLIGIELAEVLKHAGLNVYFLIMQDTYWPKALSAEEGRLVESHMREKGINVMMKTELDSINGSGGRVQSVTTKSGEEIPADIVGIATGVKPNILLAKESGIPCNKGILVNEFMETEVQNIFAAGDCVERKATNDENPSVISIWYTSRDMGIAAARNMLGDSVRYNMGEWYNSAKFFELEYTSVGRYLPLHKDDANYYIENPVKTYSMRIVHNNNTVVGFSMIGSRWDHEVLLGWIREGRSLDYFLSNYRSALFDPEFSLPPGL